MRRLRDDVALRARLRQGGLRVAAEADWGVRVRQFLRLCEAGHGGGG